MKKRNFYFGILSIFLILSVSAILTEQFKQTSKWEPSNRIFGNIDGSDKTLQEAIDEGLLINDGQVSATIAGLPLTPQSIGHSFNEIWVSVNGEEMTLQQAIETKGLSGDLTFDGNYLNAPDPSHLGIEIEISGGKSLQDSINNNEIIYTQKFYSQCYNRDSYWYDSNDRREEVRQSCGSDREIGDHYCVGNNIYSIVFVGDIYRNYSTKGCFEDSCNSEISSVKIFECDDLGNDGDVSGICIKGDCYSVYSENYYHAAPDGTCSICGSSLCYSLNDFQLAHTDTCDGDNDLSYRCSIYDNSGVDGGCMDVSSAWSCSRDPSPDRLWYGTKQVYCFSNPALIAPPGPVLPPGGVLFELA